MNLKKLLPLAGYLWAAIGGVVLTAQPLFGTLCLTMGLILIISYTNFK